MLELQRKLLGDRARNEAFYRALKKVIKPGKSVVLDIGSGTGFLSFLAEKLGAQECWLVESGDVAMLGEEIAQQNGMRHCSFVHGHSTDLPLPKADVIVSETLGNYALEEGIIGTMNDAQEYRKKDGHIMPMCLKQFVCPVVHSRIQKEIDVWDVGYGLDFVPARKISLQNMYVKTLTPKDLLQGGKAANVWDTLDFTMENDNVRNATRSWRISTQCTVYGLALWWEATLAKGITLSTSPLKKPTHWEQIYLPLLSPVTCRTGDMLTVALTSDTNPDVHVRLQWTVNGQTHDTERGFL